MEEGVATGDRERLREQENGRDLVGGLQGCHTGNVEASDGIPIVFKAIA